MFCTGKKPRHHARLRPRRYQLFEIPRYLDSEITRYRDAEIPRYRDIEVARYGYMEDWRYRDIEISRYRDIQISSWRDTDIGAIVVESACGAGASCQSVRRYAQLKSRYRRGRSRARCRGFLPVQNRKPRRRVHFHDDTLPVSPGISTSGISISRYLHDL